jgi:hypothetical protein
LLPLFEIFLNNLLPVFLCAGAGAALGRAWPIDVRSVTRLSFYIFSPCLVFASLTTIEIPAAEFGQISLFVLAFISLMVASAWLTGTALRLDRRTLMTLVIASAFVNSGNYGLAATRFAFGDEALARGVVFYVVSTLGVYTVGIFVASLGTRSIWLAFQEILRVPAFYALVLAGVARVLNWGIPLPIARAAELLGNAAIPVMLVLLGLQIAQPQKTASLPRPQPRRWVLAASVALQLLAAPAVALLLANWFGLNGITWQAVVLEASMPAAVITTVLALQYDLDADLTVQTVILSTLLSPLTLTPLIYYLQLAG